MRQGEPIVLMFVSPNCPTCRGLLGELNRTQLESPLAAFKAFVVGEPVDALCQRGDADYCFAGSRELMKALQIPLLPTAFRVDGERRIASGVALGGDAITDLVRGTAAPLATEQSASNSR